MLVSSLKYTLHTCFPPVVTLPFADIVLLTCNSATAILAASGLAICLLGEKFIWKYDLPALALIISGGTLTIIQSNKEKVEHTAEEIKGLLATPSSRIFFACGILLLCLTFYLLNS